MFKKLLSLFIILTLIIGIFTGCVAKEKVSDVIDTDTSDNKNGEIVIALEADIVSLDPQAHNDVESIKITNLLYSRLFKLNDNFETVPDLVEEWSQPAEKEWVLKIKEGVKFNDSEEVTSEDVKFSIERSKTSAPVKHVLAQVEKVEIMDKYTVKVTTYEPFAPFLNALVHSGVSIVPKHYVESNPNWENPVGSGQYKCVKWVSGDKIVLERYEDYYDESDKGIADRLIFKIIPEGTSRTIALEMGEVDLITTLDLLDINKIKDNPNLTLYQKPSTSFAYFGMNVEKSPFDSKLVRQALNYAIDKEAVLKIALDGAGVIATSVTSEALLGHKPSNYTYNPKKAKELLNEAGYDESQNIEIWASGDRRKRIAEVIQANLMDVGIKSSIEMFEWGAFLEATNSGNQMTYILGWASNPDADGTLTPQFSKNSIGAQNRSRYVNEEVEKLLVEGRAELDSTKRKKIYQRIHEIIMEDAPWVPLYVENNVAAANSKLKGVEINSQMIINMHRIHY